MSDEYEISQSVVDDKWRLWKNVTIDDYNSDWIVVGVYDYLIDVNCV